MGCVSSKIMLKSSSFREELSKSLKRTAGYPVMENLFKSNPDEDQIFTIVCTPKKQLKPLDQQKPIDNKESTTTPETINLQELMNGLEEGKQEQEEQREEIKDCVIISKKVHTVEEYDALVVTKQQEAATADCNTSSTSVVNTKDGEKGMRRKAMARELKPLKLDSFEFSSVESLREWINGEGGPVGSSGSYDTPKFGMSEKDYGGGEECSVFYPNFVAESEEAMDELTMEEENIVREMLDVIYK